MPKFQPIHDQALKRKGGTKELAKWLTNTHLSKTKLAKVGDDRFLAEMTRCVFQAGFVFRVINNKWPDFEVAFWGFAPEKMTRLSPERIEFLCQDASIVRNRTKILTVPQNALFIQDIQQEHGSFAQFIADWPSDNLIELFALLKKRGSRLGGRTGPRFLRSMGKDTFLLTEDVAHCLRQAAGLDIKTEPSSKREFKLIQEQFNEWHNETGFSYSKLSRICSCSVGKNYTAD